MFDEWRERRELRRKVASLKKQEAELLEGFIPEEWGDKPKMPAMLRFKLDSAQMELDNLEGNKLLRKARRLGIEIPHNTGWWWEDEGEAEIINGTYAGKYYLTDLGKAGVRRLIREYRRSSIEWWVSKIIVPLITALISVLSLIVALVSVSSK